MTNYDETREFYTIVYNSPSYLDVFRDNGANKKHADKKMLALYENMRDHNIVNPIFTQQSPEDQTAAIKKICAILEAEDAAYDVASYRDAPPGFRFWCGPFVQADDLECALEWVSWACTQI